MTYREILIDNLNAHDDSDSKYGSVPSPALLSFLRNVSAISLQFVDNILKQGKDKNTKKDQLNESRNLRNYLNVLVGSDLLAGIQLNLILHDFIRWLLDEPACTDIHDDKVWRGSLWHDYEMLIEKWNKYQLSKQSEE